jgi:hypothetical protein
MTNLSSETHITAEKIIQTKKGDVFRIIRKDSKGYNGFSELYLTEVKPGSFKGWKKHNRATLNLFVVSGKVDFFIKTKLEDNKEKCVSICSSSGKRLTIPPGIWLGFYSEKGAKIINFCDLIHDSTEAISVEKSYNERN